MHGNFAIRKNIAVIGTGISGMSAGLLLSQNDDVTVYECDYRTGMSHSPPVTRTQAQKGPSGQGYSFIVWADNCPQPAAAQLDHHRKALRRRPISFSVSLNERRPGVFPAFTLSDLFAESLMLLKPWIPWIDARPAAASSRGATRSSW